MTDPARASVAPGLALELAEITHDYGHGPVLEGVSLTVPEGQLVALVGASGSGKSTLLKTINRLILPSWGRVMVEGVDVTTVPLPALRRRIGYVFQGVGLFPHLTVGENVAIGPRLAGRPLDPARLSELLTLVRLDPALAARMPGALSGGQRQRVGVARALASDPRILLLDEPFGALDPVTRDALGEAVAALHRALGLTTVMVTHDMAEALLLADRVVVLEAGQIVADETPSALIVGRGGAAAQALVEVPRAQARKLAGMAP